MNAPMRRPEPAGFDDFLTFLDGRPDHEAWALIEGEIVMMTRGSERHSQIVTNLVLALGPAMRARGCRVLTEMLVRNPAEANYGAAPDVLVRCGPVEARRWVEDPVAVVEVLSPSTMDYDRGLKLAFYKRIPNLRHAAAIYQGERRIEAFDRQGEDWSWKAFQRPEDALRFETLDFAATLDAIYDGIPFD